MERRSRSYPSEKPTVVVEWNLTTTDRAATRRAVAEKWLDETPYTKYRYNVERCEDGSRVYLLRPTWLNKGFDFMVNVEGFRSKTRTPRGPTKEMPSHKDVIHDLTEKTNDRPDRTQSWFDSVCAVYECADPSTVLDHHADIRSAQVGLPSDQLLYVIKWLFTEQDITYWSQTGRDMFMKAMEKEVFGISSL